MGEVKNKTIYEQMKARKKQAQIISKIFSYLTLTVGGLIMIIPFLWMISTSLKEKGNVFTFPPEWIPRSKRDTLYNGIDHKTALYRIAGAEKRFLITDPLEKITVTNFPGQNGNLYLEVGYNSAAENYPGVVTLPGGRKKQFLHVGAPDDAPVFTLDVKGTLKKAIEYHEDKAGGKTIPVYKTSVNGTETGFILFDPVFSPELRRDYNGERGRFTLISYDTAQENYAEVYSLVENGGKRQFIKTDSASELVYVSAEIKGSVKNLFKFNPGGTVMNNSLVYSMDFDGKTRNFIEISSKAVTSNEIHSELILVKNYRHSAAKCRLLEKVDVLGSSLTLDSTLLEETGKTQQYIGKNKKICVLKEDTEFEGKIFPKGLKVLLLEETPQDFIKYKNPLSGSFIFIQKEGIKNTGEYIQIDGTQRELVLLSDSALVEKVKADTGTLRSGAVTAVKINDITYRPAEYRSDLLVVKESDKRRAEVKYLEETGDLTLKETTIVYEEKELKKADMSQYDESELAEGIDRLYFLESDPDKLFVIIEEQPLVFEPGTEVVTNVAKYSSSQEIKLTSDGKEYPVFVNQLNFKEFKYVNLRWINYFNALFKAVDPVEGDDIKGFTIMSILLGIWDKIPAFIVYFINSIVIAFTATFAELTTSCLAAYAFARLHWKGRDKIFLLYLSTMMIPGQVTMIPVFIIIKQLGWIDTYKALILPACFSAWSVFMLRQFFLSIPGSLEEAAYLDGTTKAGILVRIVIPLSKAALGTLFIFKFQHMYNEFVWPLIVTNSNHMKVIQIGLSSFQGQHSTDWTLLMAASVIVVLPVLIIYIFNQKYITQGIKLGGIKG